MNTNTTDVYALIALDTLRNGGGTYERDAFRSASLPNRYIVALGSPREIVDASEGASAFPHIVHALRTIADARGVWTPERALGTWVHDGKVYVDVVESIASLGTALWIAGTRGELAIWDNVDHVDIDVQYVPVGNPWR